MHILKVKLVSENPGGGLDVHTEVTTRHYPSRLRGLCTHASRVGAVGADAHPPAHTSV